MLYSKSSNELEYVIMKRLTLVKDIKADKFLIGTGLRDLIELRE